MSVLSSGDAVDAALRLVDTDPAEAFRTATVLSNRALADSDLATAARAERVAALASYHRTGVADAIPHLRTAVRLAIRSGSAQVEGLARMSLAGMLSFNGRSGAALREIAEAERLLDGPERLTAAAQRCLILWNSGQLDAALERYGTTLAALRESGDEVGLYTVLVNRGGAYLSRGDLPRAESDLSEGADVAARVGDVMSAAYARANLGYLYLLRGDVPRSLDVLGEAELLLRRAGAHVGDIVSMRAEALLAVRLTGEARRASLEALDAFGRERNLPLTAFARLVVAQIAAMEGSTRPGAYPEAARQAHRAVRDFRRLGRADQQTLARLLELQALARIPERRHAVRLADVERLVDEAVAAGWYGPALDGRLLAAEVAGPRRRGRAHEHLRAASLLRHGRRPADLRARAWYAEALLRADTGQPVAAERAALRGLAVLDEFRAALPATDLRAYAAAHRADLCDLGQRVALGSGDPRRVLRWAERSRATRFLQRPVTPPTDPLLADRMAVLRKAVLDLYESRNDGAGAGTVDRLRGRVAALEREIRDLSRRSDLAAQPGVRAAAGVTNRAVTRPADLADLGTALGDRALVEYLVHDGTLHAVTVVDRRARLHRLGDVATVAGLVERIPFAVQRMIRAARSPQGAQAAATLLEDAGRRLDAALLVPLAETAGRDLVVVPTGVLQALPWSVLPSCAGRPVTVSPSATVWLTAGRRPAVPGDALVVAGPRLPGAPAEAKTVAALYRTEPLVGDRARVADVSAGLARAAVAHLATHGRLSAENPLFSHLLLADGPLVVYDLERLPALPHTVVLAACESGRHVAPAGDELLGLAAAFLAGGTAQVVASVVPVPDAETAALMTALHTGLAAGRSPAHALAQAQAAAAANGPVAAATAAGFVCIGSGFVPVPVGAAATGDADRG